MCNVVVLVSRINVSLYTALELLLWKTGFFPSSSRRFNSLIENENVIFKFGIFYVFFIRATVQAQCEKREHFFFLTPSGRSGAVKISFDDVFIVV